MKARLIVFAMSITVLAMGCAPMLDVNQKFDEKVDFKAYKTYNLMAKEDVQASPDADAKVGARTKLIEDEMREALKREMEKKGFTRDTENPEILVAYYLGVRKEIFLSTWGVDYQDLSGNVATQTVEDGVIRIDFVDTETEKLVWRGTGHGAVNRDPTDEMIKTNIDRAVNKILGQYPPSKKNTF